MNIPITYLTASQQVLVLFILCPRSTYCVPDKYMYCCQPVAYITSRYKLDNAMFSFKIRAIQNVVHISYEFIRSLFTNDYIRWRCIIV